MTGDDPFGFSEARKPKPVVEPAADFASKLAAVKPNPPAAETPMEAIDEVAERRGFRSREAPPADRSLGKEAGLAPGEPVAPAVAGAPAAASATEPSVTAPASMPPVHGGPYVESPPRRRRKGETGPFVAINTRAPVRVADPFIAWCEENRYSYWQGIEELMRRAGIPTR